MTQYTTGELAQLCGVSVRTVQYYDGRGVLKPSEISTGGRRLYDEHDVRRLSVITFLREVGFSLNQIIDLLADDQSSSYIDSLITKQQQQISNDQKHVRMLEHLRTSLTHVTNADHADINAFSDATYLTKHHGGLRRIHIIMFAVGGVMDILEFTLLGVWICTGNWIPFAIGLLPIIVLGIVVSVYYYQATSYLCPHCHSIFKPHFR